MKSRNRTIIMGCAALGILTIAAQVGFTEDPKPAATAKLYKPVQPLEQMMEGQKKLFGEIKDGMLDKQWGKASQSAWILAEIANANSYQNPAADYQAWAEQMSGDSAKLAHLLKKKDETGAKELFTKIGQTCQSCHDKYQK